jgi:hypothetical protein
VHLYLVYCSEMWYTGYRPIDIMEGHLMPTKESGFSTTSLSNESRHNLTQLANLLALKNGSRPSLSDALSYAITSALSRLAEDSVNLPADMLANLWPNIIKRMNAGIGVPFALWEAAGQIIIINSLRADDIETEG